MFKLEDFNKVINKPNMRISLKDQNGLYPDNQNLALRKIKAYYSEQGHVIDFNLSDPDVVFLSVIFPEKIDVPLDAVGKHVFIGGTGHNIKVTLPKPIEHTCPNYDGMDFSFGRTSWGCPRKCSFCVTWRMEGTKTKEHSPFEEFVKHEKLLLYDANFLASPKRIEKLETIVDNRWEVSFNQGLDVRFVNDEIAQLLAKTRTRDKDWRYNVVYFAWDRMDDKNLILNGINTLLDNGMKAWRMMFYVLTGFDTTYEEDKYRVQSLIDRGIQPFVMVYNNRRDIPEIRHLARFINRRFYKTDRMTLDEYVEECLKDSNYNYDELNSSLDDFFEMDEKEGEINEKS